MAQPMKARTNLVYVLEVVFWYVVTYFARRGLDILMAQWALASIWQFALKIAGVLALIALAVYVHWKLFPFLRKRGWVEPEDGVRPHD